MKLKVLITFAFLAISSLTSASTTTCELKTNIEEEFQKFSVQLTQNGHGSMESFDTDAFKGIITSSKGFLVASITIKDTKQAMSFHGKDILGGQLIDGKEWIQINCK